MAATLTGHNGGVTDLAFSPDGTILASIAYDKTIRLWNVSSGTLDSTVLNPHTWGELIAFLPDGRSVLTFGTSATDQEALEMTGMSPYTGTVTLRRIAADARHVVLLGPTLYLDALAFCPNTLTLATTDSEGAVSLWDIRSSQIAE